MISHGSEVHALEPLSLCFLHFALSIVSYFVCVRIYTLPRQLGTDRSVHVLSYSRCLCAAPPCNRKNKCAPLARTSKHPCPYFLSPILRTDDLGLELKPGFGHIMLIGDVRHHCCRITPDRSLGFKKYISSSWGGESSMVKHSPAMLRPWVQSSVATTKLDLVG